MYYYDQLNILSFCITIISRQNFSHVHQSKQTFHTHKKPIHTIYEVILFNSFPSVVAKHQHVDPDKVHGWKYHPQG